MLISSLFVSGFSTKHLCCHNYCQPHIYRTSRYFQTLHHCHQERKPSGTTSVCYSPFAMSSWPNSPESSPCKTQIVALLIYFSYNSSYLHPTSNYNKAPPLPPHKVSPLPINNHNKAPPPITKHPPSQSTTIPPPPQSTTITKPPSLQMFSLPSKTS